ncbi:proteasome PCI domain-containing protein, putative [Eimeria acervulina]|uniref:Proteasome PCI domain-containing protein, putative n=1 Tax=Eimeria acervulina TaxID=5801 RepID=U6GT07_EIMAC|nr:proteasome PCI domain-containing protein, putative [Eimeria acervulina]CDI83391.1 proteasome PCI domain-containing protein, putative [Eimeria acervulina]
MEVDGVCDCPDWLQQLLKDPPQPFAAELQAEAAANPSAKAAIEYLQKLHEAKLYNELTDAFAYCIQLSDSVDSSSTPQLQLLQSSLGLPPPSIALDKQFKLFLSFAAELVAQVDSLRILKLCAGLLADIPAEAGLLFIEKLKAETQNKKSSHSKLLQGDSQQEKGLSSAAARCFLHALKSYLIAKTQQQQQQQQEEQQLQQLQQAQELLEAAKKQLKDIRSPDPILHSFIHRAQAEIDKARNKYGDFCRETLFFLAYTSAK